ncbi:DUF2845 domain-containing protein [Stutzerimonas zhaodongensis]|uniref:DUF2845 domain-containing protein n=1 Tax=Stutzerimonas zhaodongensis TaxID=1176257 RepID=A0A3M2HMV5_9GAMM|nr:DUF2845 domain-containing protein [Stutzerimonas zhaodongensis]MCQ4315045.1 DUF2845 domain-containing protein [Stutzerimonas zhaodongensis]RMH90368.1 DUF2845 domain-containing protein [Stutzerimonas zhaodongensis]
MSPAFARTFLFLTLVTPLAHGQTLRCGTQLVSAGDRAFEVERKCGPPAQRDLIGHTLGAYARQEFIVEEWIYGPNNGMLRILTFEGNRLRRIETRRAH